VASRLVERPGRVQFGGRNRGVGHRARAVEALEEEVARLEARVVARSGVPAIDVGVRGKVGERATQALPRGA